MTCRFCACATSQMFGIEVYALWSLSSPVFSSLTFVARYGHSNVFIDGWRSIIYLNAWNTSTLFVFQAFRHWKPLKRKLDDFFCCFFFFRWRRRRVFFVHPYILHTLLRWIEEWQPSVSRPHVGSVPYIKVWSLPGGRDLGQDQTSSTPTGARVAGDQGTFLHGPLTGHVQ